MFFEHFSSLSAAHHLNAAKQMPQKYESCQLIIIHLHIFKLNLFLQSTDVNEKVLIFLALDDKFPVLPKSK